jgi:hypothetical protein
MHDASFLQIMKAPSGNLLFTHKDPIFAYNYWQAKDPLSPELKLRSFVPNIRAVACDALKHNRVSEVVSSSRDHGSAIATVAFLPLKLRFLAARKSAFVISF